jgi:regulatory protein
MGYRRGPSESYQERRERRAAVDDPEVVLNVAARYLEARSRSVEEVRSYLEAKGYRASLLEAAIEHLVQAGFLDDERFARAWLESRDRAHPRGEQALRRELAQKGIDRDLVSALLAERAQQASEEADGDRDGFAGGSVSADLAAARRLLERRGTALRRIDDPRLRRQRAYALLARNGFDPEVCRTASRLLDDPSADAQE